MDSTGLVRLRWRLKGAWMWKLFALLLAVDAVVGHALPPLGDGESLVGAALVAAVLELAVIVLLSAPLMLLIRARRPDLPKLVARDYGGTAALCAVTAGLLVAGVIHHSTLVADRDALQDAVARAQAYIGDRAPSQFQRDLRDVDVYAVQPPRIYRVCAGNLSGTQTYCVIVDRDQPLGTSVRFAGDEPNSLLSDGTG